jgi:hypothetical protein
MKSPGSVQRMLTALGRALKRGILGKSSNDYMKQFTGSDQYWDEVVAAQKGWLQKQPPQPDPEAFDGSGHHPQPEFEPVHGWTKRQLEDYLARNPGYRPTYEAKLQNTRS